MEPGAFTELVEAVDNGWAFGVLVVVLMYTLVWRFGGQIIAELQDNKAETKRVQEQITTNHGEPNLGKAVDALTDSIALIIEAAEHDRTLMRTMTRAQARDRKVIKKIASAQQQHIADHAKHVSPYSLIETGTEPHAASN